MKQHLKFALKVQTDNMIRNVTEELESLTKIRTNLESMISYETMKAIHSRETQRVTSLKSGIKNNLKEVDQLVLVLASLQSVLSTLSVDVETKPKEI